MAPLGRAWGHCSRVQQGSWPRLCPGRPQAPGARPPGDRLEAAAERGPPRGLRKGTHAAAPPSHDPGASFPRTREPFP